MASEWTEVTLDQLGRIVTGKTPPSSRPDYFGGDIPFVTPTDFDGRRIIETTGRYLTEQGADSVAARIPARAVMVSCIGSDMGKAAVAGRECVTNQQINSIIVARPNDPLFVYYNLSTRKEEIRGAAGGSAQPILNKSAFGRLEIPLPPPDEQRAIAHILGTLDDKIELNRRMSETLEQMARALFKSWFIDFDPVRRNAARARNQPSPRPVGHPSPIGRGDGGEGVVGSHAFDHLFPARLVDSELGEIPEGWREGSFGDLISQRTERVGSRDVVVLSALASGNLARSDDHFAKRVYSQEMEKYLLVEQWDFAYNPSRINIGSIGMLEESILGAVSPVYVVARPKSSYRWFLHFSIHRTYTKEWINTLASGSVRQTLSYVDFASIPCVIPPEGVVQTFNQRWTILRERIRSLAIESRTLAALRDALLPKLISGELRVKSADRFVTEEVA